MRVPLLAALLALGSVSCSRPAPHRDNAGLPRTIAHALGGIDGAVYTNSREAFRLNYAQGCRTFEADIWVTSDSHVVLFHDGQEKDFGLDAGFDSVAFEKARVYGKYTPVDTKALVDMFVEHPDWRMVTDVKNDQREALTLLCKELAARGVDCKERLLPQVYNLTDDYETVKSLGFPRIILTLYRIDQSVTDKQVVDFVRAHPDVVAVTMFAFRWNDKLVADLNALNVKVFVHTVNESLWMQELMKHGVWGVYTDTGCPSLDPDSRPKKN